MKNVKKTLLALSLGTSLVAGAALANDPPPVPSPGSSVGSSSVGPSSGGPPSGGATRAERRFARGDGKPGEGRRGELRERVRQKVQTYVTVELSTRAGLDEKKSLQLGTAIKAHMERKQKARESKKQEMDKLRTLVDSKGNDAALKAQMKTLVDAARDEEQLQLLVDDMAKFLTPSEQARVVVALPAVLKDTMKMVREARGKRGGRGGGGGGGFGGGGGGGFGDDVSDD